MNQYFEKLCKMSVSELKDYVAFKLLDTHSDITIADGFVFAKGDFPVLLVAHLDTVHKELPSDIEYREDGSVITSPQGIGGDDRCGVYMIFELLKAFNCSVLFTEDEEIGMLGSKKFVRHDVSRNLSFNYVIQLDRKGVNDAVFYDLKNPEFEKFITKDYFNVAIGLLSDISVIAPYLDNAAVNFSCGYINPHTLDEYVDLNVMNKVIEEIKKILSRTDIEKDKFAYFVW